jgi:hypothetical protein
MRRWCRCGASEPQVPEWIAISEKLISGQIGQKSKSISDETERAYRRSDMREKRRKLMQDWADYCA